MAETERPAVAWYFKTSVVVIALLSVGPLALPMVWFHPRYKALTKIWVTVITVIVTYYSVIAFSGSFKLMMNLYRELAG